jgi:5'-phosphate synthase pdxT subunit
VDAVVLPGGESTTMSMLLDSAELFDPLAERLAAGLPALGTCAGMILLASEVLDGRPDQRCFAAIDLSVRRNGYGRQVDSFESDLSMLAAVDGRPVLCRQGQVTVAAFHPELSDDLRIHDQFLKEIG